MAKVLCTEVIQLDIFGKYVRRYYDLFYYFEVHVLFFHDFFLPRKMTRHMLLMCLTIFDICVCGLLQTDYMYTCTCMLFHKKTICIVLSLIKVFSENAKYECSC